MIYYEDVSLQINQYCMNVFFMSKIKMNHQSYLANISYKHVVWFGVPYFIYGQNWCLSYLVIIEILHQKQLKSVSSVCIIIQKKSFRTHRFCKILPVPYRSYYTPWVLFFKMVFWLGLNQNLTKIWPIFINFWPKSRFLIGVLLDF